MRQLAPLWNGTLLRPSWWTAHKQRQRNLTFYRFSRPDHRPAGYLSLATRQHERHGARLDVHDFCAGDEDVASSMLAFLGRHNSRIPSIAFQRTSLPPHHLLLHGLHRYDAATADTWGHEQCSGLVDQPWEGCGGRTFPIDPVMVTE